MHFGGIFSDFSLHWGYVYMEDFIPGCLNPGRNSTVFTWHDSSRKEWNLQAKLSCSVHPRLGLLHEFILDYALVSEKVGKIVNFEKHDVWPWREPGNVWTMSKICSRFSVFTSLSLFSPGRKQLHVNMENRTPKYACSSWDNFPPGLVM